MVCVEGQYTWNSGGISERVANEIKEAYAQSMKKWNNVYYYSYDANGNVIKNKVINVVEGTESDHNITIYPDLGINALAGTLAVGYSETLEMINLHGHIHNYEWIMRVNIVHFYEHGLYYTADYVNAVREKAGAHEFGHVLGLYDVENYCKAEGAEQYHHQELLMGYGSANEDFMQDITYKDIAGVAITRGFHTDADHKWLFHSMSGVKSKLICAICNGVKYVDSILGIPVGYYNYCGGQHDLSDGNMIAVASYGTTDYYKCIYCRYVAPFSSRVNQDYVITSMNDTYHKYENTVPGLEYTIIEEHDMTSNGCLICLKDHDHNLSYSPYAYYNSSSHIRVCTCGESQIQAHYVMNEDIMGGRYANCLGCNAELDLTKDNAQIIFGVTNMRTANGSYILPNGIVVLVAADFEAYMDGTLTFYHMSCQASSE